MSGRWARTGAPHQTVWQRARRRATTRVYSCFYSCHAMYRQHKRMRVGTFLTPERNTAAHNAHSPRTVRRRRCSAVPVATQGQLPAPLAVGPDHQIGNLEGARETAFCLKLRTLKTIKGLQKLQNLYSDPPSSATRNNCGSPELPREKKTNRWQEGLLRAERSMLFPKN